MPASQNLSNYAFRFRFTAPRYDAYCKIWVMFSEGFRPEIKDKHLTIVKFVSSVLGNEFKALINNYDFMRRKRHRFIYEPGIPCFHKEAKDALQTAEQFLDAINKLIKEKNPQLEFDFKENPHEQEKS